jgi:tetratricopeptide (TPR) repeat protein
MNLTSRNVSRTDLDALFAEAEKCTTRYDLDGAIGYLQRMHKLEPTSDRILVRLGTAHANAYDFPAADQCFEKALSISQTRVEALNAVAHSWLTVRKYEKAKDYFEQILQEKQIPVVVMVRLAEIYIRLRRVEDAGAMAARALQMYRKEPGSGEAAWLLAAKVHRQMGNLGEAEKLLRTIVSNPSYKGEIRATAWYELAGILDHTARYDEAMKSFMEAKSLMTVGAGNFLKILRIKQASMKALATNVPPGIVQRWREFGERELQPSRRMALLCGHARSGTTLLEYVLDSHPDIITAEETSVFHNKAYFPIGCAVSPNTPFTSTLDWMPARTLRQIRTNYFKGIESFLGQPIGDKLLLDKNPANTFDLPAMARIFPEMRFIVALRDPRDVCLSCFMQAVIPIPDSASWLTLEGAIHHYTLIMGIWTAWKDQLKDQAIEVRYEDLIENLETATRPVLDLVGLGWDERIRKFNEHASNKVVLSPTFAEVTKPLYKSAMGRWHNYKKYFDPHMKKLEPFFKAFGYQ